MIWSKPGVLGCHPAFLWYSISSLMVFPFLCIKSMYLCMYAYIMTVIYASLTRRIIIFDQTRCVNHSMCWIAAHHPQRRQSEWASHHRFSRFCIQHVAHPWPSRSIQLQLTTQMLSTDSTAHALAVGSGWCTLLVRAGCQFAVKRLDAEAKAKLWVHCGSLPCCLNISLSVYTETSKSPERHRKPVGKLHGNLASVQL